MEPNKPISNLGPRMKLAPKRGTQELERFVLGQSERKSFFQ